MLLSISGIPAGSEETTFCGQAKKQSSCCCCRVAGGLEDSTLWCASLCCCSVRSCQESHTADVRKTQCTFILRPILPVGKLSFSKIRHCNLGHPSCHGKSRLCQHNRDLALSTAAFFPSNSATSHSPFPVLISKSQTLQEGCTTEELTHLWRKH